MVTSLVPLFLITFQLTVERTAKSYSGPSSRSTKFLQMKVQSDLPTIVIMDLVPPFSQLTWKELKGWQDRLMLVWFGSMI